MFKIIGLFLVFVSWFGLSQSFDLQLAGTLILGIFMMLSEGIFGHILFIQREKVRSHYRARQRG